MKKELLILIIALPLLVRGQVDCNNDTTHYPAPPGKQVPSIPCKTFLITEKYLLKSKIREHKADSVQRLLKEIINTGLDLRNLNIQQVQRQERYIDSLDQRIKEKDIQLDSLRSISVKAIENTDKALDLARKNRNLAYGSLAGAIIIILLVLFK